MTDVSGPLGSWRVVLTGCLAVLTAAVATVVVRTGDPATADTLVVSAVAADLVLADGRELPASAGDLVPPGALVRTAPCAPGAPCGEAQLRTAGRDVYLSAGSALRVTDGVHQGLERGQAMLDSRRGARVELATRAGVLAVDRGALVRVELGQLLMRVAAFEGAARLGAVDRQATTEVARLHQVRAPYVGLPGRPTALSLTGDAWEERLAHDLVEADRDLVRLAAGLAGNQGRAVLTVAPAALRTPPPVLAADLGEEALAVAVAQAGEAGRSASERLAGIRTSRAEGGSWGVVAALAEARVSAVSRVIDAWLQGPDDEVPVGAVGEPSFDGVLGGPRPTPGPSTTGGPTRTPGPRPTTTRTPTPDPTTPEPSPSDLITTITGLISPSPSAAGTKSPLIDLGIIRIR